MAVKDGDTVTVHYTGKLEDGTQFDSSAGRDPLQFTVGAQQLIPGFEQAVLGMSPGESKSITIAPENAYGDHQEQLVIEVPRADLGADLDPKVGEELEMTRGEESFVLVVTATNESTVTLDGNHALAGKTLLFDIELVEVS